MLGWISSLKQNSVVFIPSYWKTLNTVSYIWFHTTRILIAYFTWSMNIFDFKFELYVLVRHYVDFFNIVSFLVHDISRNTFEKLLQEMLIDICFGEICNFSTSVWTGNGKHLEQLNLNTLLFYFFQIWRSYPSINILGTFSYERRAHVFFLFLLVRIPTSNDYLRQKLPGESRQ